MDAYASLSLNKVIKTVRVHKGHRKQRMNRVQRLVGFLEENLSLRGSPELKKEIKNYIKKANDLSADLQYLILQETWDGGIKKYTREMQALGHEDGDLVMRVSAVMLEGLEPEAALDAGPATNNIQNADSAPQ